MEGKAETPDLFEEEESMCIEFTCKKNWREGWVVRVINNFKWCNREHYLTFLYGLSAIFLQINSVLFSVCFFFFFSFSYKITDDVKMWSELIYSKYERRWYFCLFYSNHILYTIIIFYRKDVQQYETELFYAWRNKKNS